MIDTKQLREHIAANAAKGIHAAPVVLELIQEVERLRDNWEQTLWWLELRIARWGREADAGIHTAGTETLVRLKEAREILHGIIDDEEGTP